MGIFYKKLNSRKGSSMMLSLIFLMFCVVIGSVLLGSAVTSAQKLEHDAYDAKMYFAVSSAARLLKESITGQTYTGKESKIEYDCNGEDDPIHADDVMSRCDLTNFLGEYKDNLLNQAAWAVFCSNTKYYTSAPKPSGGNYTETFIIKAEGLPDVQGTLTMAASDPSGTGLYNAVIELKPVTETGVVTERYAVSMIFSASVTVAETSEVFDHCEYEKNVGGVIKKTVSDITTTTRTTTIFWTVFIRKGVDSHA